MFFRNIKELEHILRFSQSPSGYLKYDKLSLHPQLPNFLYLNYCFTSYRHQVIDTFIRTNKSSKIFTTTGRQSVSLHRLCRKRKAYTYERKGQLRDRLTYPNI